VRVVIFQNIVSALVEKIVLDLIVLAVGPVSNYQKLQELLVGKSS
jgi:hypothetical protein